MHLRGGVLREGEGMDEKGVLMVGCGAFGNVIPHCLF